MYGEWWIDTRDPDQDDNIAPPHTVAGNLLDDGLSGWRLETIGNIGPGLVGAALRPGGDEFFGQTHTIHGFDSANNWYSLLDCSLANGSTQAPSVRGGVHYWRVGIIVKTTGVMITPDVEVDRIDLRISNLGIWAFDARQSLNFDEPDVSDQSNSSLDHSLSTQIHDHEFQIRWSPTPDVQANVGTDAIVQIDGPLNLLKIDEAWITPVTRLISLLTGRTAYITGIQARLRDWLGRGYRTYVDVRIPQPLEEQLLYDPKESAGRQQHEMLATRPALERCSADIPAFVSSYFVAQEDDDLRDALHHFIDSQAKPSGYKFDDSLLYAFNSFESYHGALHDSNWAVDDDLATTYDALISHAPAEHRETVRNRLSKRPPKSFQMMLDDVMGDCGDAVTPILEAFPEVKRSLEKLRNTIAHTNQGSMTLRHRVDMLVTLHWIMRRALLQAFGLPSDICDQVFDRSFVFNDHVRRIAARYGPQQQE